MRRTLLVFLPAIVCLPSALEGQAPTQSPTRPSGLLAGELPYDVSLEQLTTFDYRSLQLRWSDDHWQIWAGSTLLKDFGKRESDARAGLRIIRELRLTQHGTIGTPFSLVEYWLSDGKPPKGPLPGAKTLSFEPAQLRVEQTQGQWYLRDLRQTSWAFGSHVEEARQALAILRHYGFNQVGYVGPFPPVMMYFLATKEEQLQTPKPNHVVSHPASANRMLQTGPAASKVLRPSASFPGNPAGESALTPASLPSGRQLTSFSLPLPGQVNSGERIPINWRHADVQKQGEDWKLICDGSILAHFGANERDARQALTVLQYHRFTEQYLVGNPVPFFTYFLVNGQAPRTLCLGVVSTPFATESLRVLPIGNNWVVADDTQSLITCGDKEKNAKQVLKIIQQHQFDHLCRVGNFPDGGMIYLVRTHFKRQNGQIAN